MKRYIIISLIFIANTNLFSQTTFSRTYNILNGNEWTGDVLMKDNKYFLLGEGLIDPYTDIRGCTYFLIVDEEDNVLYVDTFENNKLNFSSHKPFAIQDDTVFVFADDLRVQPHKFVVYKTNFQGDSLGVFIYDDFMDSNRLYARSINIRGEYLFISGIISLENAVSKLVVLKLDRNGNKLKEEFFLDFAPSKNGYGMSETVETSDGNFVLSNIYANNDKELIYVGVCKFDENLNVLWSKYLLKTYGGSIYNQRPNLTATLDGGMVMSSGMDIWNWKFNNHEKYDTFGRWPLLFYKLDKDGNVEWRDTMFTYRFDEDKAIPRKSVRKLLTARNGDIIGIGKYDHPDKPSKRAWMFRYSPDGKLKWERYYYDRKYYGWSYFIGVKEAENGDIVCTGDLGDDDGVMNNNRYSWLLRVDSMGCYTPGCHTDSLSEVWTDIEEIVLLLPEKIIIYPNPTSGDINIELPKDIDWSIWSIYGMDGKKVNTGSLELNTSKIRGGVHIDGSDLKSGVYFLQVGDGKGRFGAGKFVVE